MLGLTNYRWPKCPRAAPCDFCMLVIELQQAENNMPCVMPGCRVPSLPGFKFCGDCIDKLHVPPGGIKSGGDHSPTTAAAAAEEAAAARAAAATPRCQPCRRPASGSNLAAATSAGVGADRKAHV